MVAYRKVIAYVPVCPTCGGDLLDGEDYTPAAEEANPVPGKSVDPALVVVGAIDESDLYCPTCDPIPYDPTALSVLDPRMPQSLRNILAASKVAAEALMPKPFRSAPVAGDPPVQPWPAPPKIERSPDGVERAGWAQSCAERGRVCEGFATACYAVCQERRS